MFRELLVNDVVQFYYEKRAGYVDEIFTLITVIRHFICNKSSVFAAALDVSKTSDCINYKLLTQLLGIGLLQHIIDFIFNWYSKQYMVE